MKNTSRTMFNIGNIVNICYLGLGGLLALIGLLIMIIGGATGADEAAKAAAIASGGGIFGWGLYFLITSILALVFVGKAKRELADESSQNNGPFIVCIVFGAISSNPFYVLAGIFGLIAESQERNAQQPKAVEESKEEPVEEPKEE